MNNKEKYKVLCETEGTRVPLFLQYWWMETVCVGKQWDVALVEKEGDGQWSPERVQGALPYLIGKRIGMRYVLQPQLTQYNGPYYRYEEGLSDCRRLEFEKKVGAELTEQLERLRLAYYEQNFAPSVTNWMPFHWAGYRQTTRYTYRIEQLDDLDTVLSQMDYDKRQRKIRKAQEHLHADEGMTPEEFARFHATYWKSRGEKDLLSEEFIVRVIKAACARNQGLLLALKDGDGVIRAARFVVYDDHCAYSLLSALHPEGHDNGASALLFWELFQRLQHKTRAFDFEGSMDAGIEYSYRLYGARQVPYFNISKCNNDLFRLLLWIKARKG